MKCTIIECNEEAIMLVPLEVDDYSLPHPHKKKIDIPLCNRHYNALEEYFCLHFNAPSPPTPKRLEACKVASLEKLKTKVNKHLRNGLDLFKDVLKLSEQDAKEFHTWYTNHPLVKGIKEVLEILTKGKVATATGDKNNEH